MVIGLIIAIIIFNFAGWIRLSSFSKKIKIIILVTINIIFLWTIYNNIIKN